MDDMIQQWIRGDTDRGRTERHSERDRQQRNKVMVRREIAKAGQDDPAKPVVLFDGACPLCRREVAHYRRLRGAERLHWVDIVQTPDLEARFGVARDVAMARFHVRDGAGQWQTGAHGFVEVWRHLTGYRWLARAVRGLRLVRPLDRAYQRFADWRLARRCDTGSCRSLSSGRSTASAQTNGE
jgi:predicted DCC family thiol-disulfide oxidoreductase YuxK